MGWCRPMLSPIMSSSSRAPVADVPRQVAGHNNTTPIFDLISDFPSPPPAATRRKHWQRIADIGYLSTNK